MLKVAVLVWDVKLGVELEPCLKLDSGKADPQVARGGVLSDYIYLPQSAIPEFDSRQNLRHTGG
jgi:hypothetical protein